MKLLLVVAVALVDADNRVLLAQRPEGKQLAGLWEFPGGKVEPGEGPDGSEGLGEGVDVDDGRHGTDGFLTCGSGGAGA